MDAQQQDQQDLGQVVNRLSPKDKEELRQFINQETQRAEVQKQTHNLTKMCWKTCVTGTIRGPKLDKNEQTCMASCVERFLDVNHLTIKHLESMRN
jgi:import inner membrane translocase subunit TIM8